MRSAFYLAHKYLALSVGLLWVLQALSGILLVFHRPIDDFLLDAAGQPERLEVVDAAVVEIERATHDAKVIEYFPSGGVAGQFDILVDRAVGIRDVVRVDGATGKVLRTSAWEQPWSELTVFRLALLFHKQLLGGEIGHWIIGFSGAVLFISIVLGLLLAWPAKKRWRATLLPPRVRAPAAALFAWHRAIGLWFAPLGLLMALTGGLMVWSTDLERVLGVTPVPPVAGRLLGPNDAFIPPSAAVAVALRAFNRATLAVVTFPSPHRSWYAIRLRQPGELRQVYGTTSVVVDATTGDILQAHDAVTASLLTRMLAGLWPIHSGEWGAVTTRIITLTTGLWLATTVGLGLTLWWTRRRTKTVHRRRAT